MSSIHAEAVYARTHAGHSQVCARPDLADWDTRLLMRLNGLTPLVGLVRDEELGSALETLERIVQRGWAEPSPVPVS